MESQDIYEEFLRSPAGSVQPPAPESDDPKLISGVPLGGIGTGKFEICPDGALRHFTINNNNVFPIDEMGGTFLALSARWGGSKTAKILQTRSRVLPADRLIGEGEIGYRGLYPRCIVEYRLKDTPLRVRLTAFSPVIPNSPETSSLPLAFLIFEVQNAGQVKVEGSISFSWEDVNGCWGSKVSWDDFVPPTEPHVSEDRGLAREVDVSPFARGVSFYHRKRHPEVADFAWGDYSLVVESRGRTFVRQYDPSDAKALEGLLGDLSDKGYVDDRVENRRGEVAAMVGSTFSLWGGEKERMVFAVSWYTPDRWGFGEGDIASRVATPYDSSGRKMGQWYASFYTSSLDVLRGNLASWEELLGEVQGWQASILESTLPPWLQEMLINQNYLLSTNMTWTKDGRFTILESPNCPCLGTLDQRFYGSPMTLLFCPELDHRELMMYAEFSDKMYEKLGKYKGQIYHDFGNNRMDYLNNYGYNWIDLNPKFVLLCWRNYLYTGNLDSLKEIYYKIKETMERERELDRDGDLLPEGYGNCNTYEGGFFGANSYDGGLWLAALKVFPKVAHLMGDEKAAAEHEEAFTKAKVSFEEKLWDEEKGHYIMCTEKRDTRREEELEEEDRRYLKRTENPRNDQCRDDQLTGAWYSTFLGEGPVNDPQRVARAIKTMERLLKSPVSSDGVLIRQSELVNQNWPGYNMGHFASLAIQMGYVELGLAAVKGIHDLIYDKWGMVWDQPIGLPIKGRPRGDRYMNSASIWHVLWALQGFLVDIHGGVLGFRPNIPPAWKSGFVTPIVTGAFWGKARYRESTGEKLEVELELTLDQDFEVRRLLLNSGGFRKIEEIEIEGAESGEFSQRINAEGDLVLEFEEPLGILESCPVRIVYRLG